MKAFLLLGGLVAALAAAGWAIGGVRGTVVFGVIAFLMAATLYWTGPRVLLASLRARELASGDLPDVIASAERLAARTRVVPPRLYVVDDVYPFALSVGRGAADLHVAFSRGLLEVVSEAELDGLLAHEITHARHRDVAVQTPVTLLALWLVEASRIGGWLQRAFLFVLAPVAASIVATALSPRREYAADRAAATLCNSPHGLADALVRLEQARELLPFAGASPATEPLFAVSPFGDDRLAALFATHPPTRERVRRLRALDPRWSEGLRAA